MAQKKMSDLEKEMTAFKASFEVKIKNTKKSAEKLAQKGLNNYLILPKINVNIGKPNDNKSFDMRKRSKKEKTYIKIFKSAIVKNKGYIPNYKQCLNEINKEFYITGTVLNMQLNEKEEKEKILQENILQKAIRNIPGGSSSRISELVGGGRSNQNINDNKLKPVKRTAQEKEDLRRLKEIEEKQAIAQAKRKRAQRRLRLLKNCMRYLLSNGVNIQSYIESNPFPLKPFSLPYSESFISSVKFNNISIVKEALELNKAYLFEYDYFKQTCFHWAAKLGYSELLKFLLSKGKCCNIYDNKLRTPIYLAALNNQRECCEILLQHRANLDFADIDGKKPSDVVTDPSLRLLLLDHLENPIDLAEMNKDR